jgi:hypothetical protein
VAVASTVGVVLKRGVVRLIQWTPPVTGVNTCDAAFCCEETQNARENFCSRPGLRPG